MAKLRYVDWDGLVYYDGKIKKYVDDKLEEVIKVGKSVTFDKLPDPSSQNINYIYKVTDSFTSDTRFEKQGLMYPAGTVVLVSNINDVYLYTIFCINIYFHIQKIFTIFIIYHIILYLFHRLL